MDRVRAFAEKLRSVTTQQLVGSLKRTAEKAVETVQRSHFPDAAGEMAKKAAGMAQDAAQRAAQTCRQTQQEVKDKIYGTNPDRLVEQLKNTAETAKRAVLSGTFDAVRRIRETSDVLREKLARRPGQGDTGFSPDSLKTAAAQMCRTGRDILGDAVDSLTRQPFTPASPQSQAAHQALLKARYAEIFTCARSYGESRLATGLIQDFVAGGRLISKEDFWIYIEYADGLFAVWGENYPYAWLQRCIEIANVDGALHGEHAREKRCLWNEAVPSREAMALFAEWMGRHCFCEEPGGASR